MPERAQSGILPTDDLHPDLYRDLYWRERILLALLALLLLLLAATAINLPDEAMDDSAVAAASGPILPLARASAAAQQQMRWDALWADLETAMDASLMQTLSRQVLGEPLPPGGLAGRGIRPAGDTWHMRHPAGFPMPSQALHRRFQAASLSNDPEQRVRLLQGIVSETGGMLAYRAWLEIARIRLRGGNAQRQQARVAINAALRQPDVMAAPRGDALYLRGYLALEERQFRPALTDLRKAVALDAYHFDARAALARALYAAAPRQRGECLSLATEMIEQVQWLGVLAEDRGQFVDLAQAFGQLSGGEPAFKAFLVAVAAFLGGEQSMLVTAEPALADSAASLPGRCRTALLDKARWMLAQTQHGG
jgi:tetratricopeptide (TPR) repeat protein